MGQGFRFLQSLQSRCKSLQGCPPRVAGNVTAAVVTLTQAPLDRTSRTVAGRGCFGLAKPPGAMVPSSGAACFPSRAPFLGAPLEPRNPDPRLPPRLCLHYATIVAGRKNGAQGTQPQRSKGWARKQMGPRFRTSGSENQRPRYHDPSEWSNQVNGDGAHLVEMSSVVSGVDLNNLKYNEALGQVMSREANFVRVVVTSCFQGMTEGGPHSQSNSLSRSGSGSVKHPRDSASGKALLGSATMDVPMSGKAASQGVDGEKPLAHVGFPQKGAEILCVVRALLKKIQKTVLVGDYVVLSPVDWTEQRGAVHDVLPRRSAVRDPPIANVNHLVVLFSLAAPSPEEANVSRFLVAAEATGLSFSLVLNKADIVPKEKLQEWDERLRGWGYTPFFISVQEGTGIEALQQRLQGSTSVVVGPSGVGKSSLINFLRSPASILATSVLQHPWQPHAGSQAEGSACAQGESMALSGGFEDRNAALELPAMAQPSQQGVLEWRLQDEDAVPIRVGAVSLRSGKGRHTTRHVSLLRLPGGGLLADSPGFSQPSLIDVSSMELPELFPEVRQRLEGAADTCAFVDCCHVAEPGCVVGVDWSRFPQYLSLREEIRAREDQELRSMGTKREASVRMKSKGAGKNYAEPKLEMKKHRRVSRKHANQSLADELEELAVMEVE